MMNDFILRAGELSLALRPSWGGRVAKFDHARHGDLLVPITSPTFVPDAWPKAGGYPLVPFHNRIRHARFAFEGRTAALPVHPDAAPHALHGMGSRADWQMVADDDRSARMMWRRGADAAWPWSFVAEQHFSLSAQGLALSLTITNEDTVPMPAGLGWHPYFPSRFTFATDARLQWPEDEFHLPHSHHLPAQALTYPTTAHLSDWRNVNVRGDGLAMTMRAQNLDHLVVYVPDAPYFCIEPVSHIAGAANDPQRRSGIDEGGMHRVEPGQTLTATVNLQIDQG